MYFSDWNISRVGLLNGLKISSEGLSKLTDFVIQFDKNAFFRMIFTPVTTLGTVK